MSAELTAASIGTLLDIATHTCDPAQHCPTCHVVSVVTARRVAAVLGLPALVLDRCFCGCDAIAGPHPCGAACPNMATHYHHDATPLGAGTFWRCPVHAPPDATPYEVRLVGAR